MRTVIVILMLAATMAMASYAIETIHRNDAMAVHLIIQNAGYSNSDFQVMIARDDGDVHYLIAWEDEHYAPDYDDQDLGRLLISIGAAGAISEQTTWTSSMVMVGFTNKMFGCSTSAARYLVANVGNMSENDLYIWVAINMVSQDM